MDRYEEALERAKAGKPVDEVFPELKESEDERIRKEMIYFFTEEIPKCSIKEHADKIRVFISWLEKQKEQKGSLRVIKDASEWEIIKEQKPAEWSEEEIVNWLKENFYVSSFDNTKIVTKFSSMDDLIKSVRKRLKSLPERFNLQPKQEWREEDEWMINSIISTLEANKVFTYKSDKLGQIDHDKKIAWLKSLRPQPKAEWSEEDEKDIQEASEYLRDYANNCVQGGNSKLYLQSLADRIESLRPQPHWKPSEEQMAALNGAWTNFDSTNAILKTLYDDLKKLM